MRVRIRPRLINRRDQDPGLMVDLEGARDCVLVDCGSLEAVPKADLLRVSSIFVSHTHIDHFCGFDRLLRNVLGQVVRISIFGPPGITGNVLGKLSGYTWNLIDEDGPVFVVSEIDGESVTVTTVRCRKGFRPEGPATTSRAVDGLIVSDGRIRVRCAALDHGVPSLAYSLQEEPFASVDSDRLTALGLTAGPWLKRVQEAALGASPRTVEVEIGGRAWTAGDLADQLVVVKPGRKVAYVSDTVFSDRVLRAVTSLAANADDFFCEANFQEADAARAAAYHHLTARQAGLLAREARVRRLILYHVSRKYHGDVRTSLEEASEVFSRVD